MLCRSSTINVCLTVSSLLPTKANVLTAAGTYNDKFPTELADMLAQSLPTAVTRLVSQVAMHAEARKEPERFDDLEAAGFKCERYGDISHHIFERMGGHYMDVGASARIADGLVRHSLCILPKERTLTQPCRLLVDSGQVRQPNGALHSQ